jgi:hypothetical protein
MRPAKAAPGVSFVSLPLWCRPNACNTNHRGSFTRWKHSRLHPKGIGLSFCPKTVPVKLATGRLLGAWLLPLFAVCVDYYCGAFAATTLFRPVAKLGIFRNTFIHEFLWMCLAVKSIYIFALLKRLDQTTVVLIEK